MGKTRQPNIITKTKVTLHCMVFPRCIIVIRRVEGDIVVQLNGYWCCDTLLFLARHSECVGDVNEGSKAMRRWFRARRRAIDANRWVGSLRRRAAAYFGSPADARVSSHAWGGLYRLISALARVRAPWDYLSLFADECTRHLLHQSCMLRIFPNPNRPESVLVCLFVFP